jgi:hypothetical protein
MGARRSLLRPLLAEPSEAAARSVDNRWHRRRRARFRAAPPRLLYAHLGVELGGDAYSVAGYETERPVIKLGWNILLNAPSRRTAIVALADELGGPAQQARSADILRAIERRHQPIRDALGSGLGLRLQRIDHFCAAAVIREGAGPERSPAPARSWLGFQLPALWRRQAPARAVVVQKPLRDVRGEHLREILPRWLRERLPEVTIRKSRRRAPSRYQRVEATPASCGT